MKPKTKTVIIVSAVALVAVVGLALAFAFSGSILFWAKGLLAQSGVSDLSNSSLSMSSGTSCECVIYFLNKLNDGKPVSGDWPTAGSMASTDYWSKTKQPRYRSQTARAGDIVIMQPYAKVYPWSSSLHGWDYYFKDNQIGYGAGHIGIVLKAEYWNDYGGWFITLQSANWSWGYQYSDAGCSNVTESQVFIPNGDAVSFWRVK
jgi:hypothetical protein